MVNSNSNSNSNKGPGRPRGTWRANATAGKSAMHPGLKMTWKRALKIERIARLSLDPAGYSNEQIANHLGCDKQTIVYIRQTPEYQAKMLELASGVVSLYDQDLRQNVDNARQELISMIPSSLMVIRDALLNRKNPNLQFKAALEVMDREGSMAKVSKTSVAVNVVPHMQVDAEVSTNLMALLAGAPQSNSANSVSASTGGFTITAQDAAVQQTTMKDDTGEVLETLEIKDSKPN